MSSVERFMNNLYDMCENNLDSFVSEIDGVSEEFKELSIMTESYLRRSDLTEEQREKIDQLHHIFSTNVFVDWMENDPKDEFSEICSILKDMLNTKPQQQINYNQAEYILDLIDYDLHRDGNDFFVFDRVGKKNGEPFQTINDLLDSLKDDFAMSDMEIVDGLVYDIHSNGAKELHFPLKNEYNDGRFEVLSNIANSAGEVALPDEYLCFYRLYKLNK